MNKQFIFPIRVYYEDTDAGGVVYHANYLKFMERARTEMCRELGFELDQLAKQGYLLVVKSAWLDYFQPAKLGDSLEVVTSIDEHSKIRAVFNQTVRLAQNPDTIFCKGVITIVSVNQNMRPCEMVKGLLEGLTGGN
jgi:acyl-CoA thioester hydrolase